MSDHMFVSTGTVLDASATPIGSAFAIDYGTVVTCAHVIADRPGRDLRIAFGRPDAGGVVVPVADVHVPAAGATADIAVLRLADALPDDVAIAPLRFPRPADLVDRDWQTVSAQGTVGEELGYGWMALDGAAAAMQPGFSGAPIWSQDYNAVVGIVGAADNSGSARALTLYGADKLSPELDLRRREHHRSAPHVPLDDVSGGPLDKVAEALSRQVSVVVVGPAGSGKTWLLAHLLVKLAEEGRPSLRVSVRGKAAIEVVREVAGGLSARLPETMEEAASSRWLDAVADPRTVVVVDGVDEALDGRQTRLLSNYLADAWATRSRTRPQLVVTGRPESFPPTMPAKFGWIELDRRGDLAAKVRELAGHPLLLTMLTALAAADPVDVEFETWRWMTQELGGRLSKDDLAEPALRDIVEARQWQDRWVYRFVHAAFAEFFLSYGVQASRAALVQAMRRRFGPTGWSTADPLTLRLFAVLALSSRAMRALADEDGFLERMDDVWLLSMLDGDGDEEIRRKLSRLKGSRLRGERLGNLEVLSAVEQLPGRRTNRHAAFHARWAITDPGLAPTTWQAHDSAVTALIAVPIGDDHLVASAGSDGAVRLWNSRTGVLRRTLRGHRGAVTALAAVPLGDRRWLASAGSDAVVLVWDADSGQLRSALNGHAAPVLSVCAVEVDGRTLLVTAGSDDQARIWDPLTGKLEGILASNEDTVALAALPDGRLLSAASDGAIASWDLRSRRRTFLSTAPIPPYDLVAVEGNQVALGTPAGVAIAELAKPRSVVLKSASTHAVAMAADGLVTGSEDGVVRLWDPLRQELIREFVGHLEPVRAVAAVGTLIVSGDNDGVIRVWDPAQESRAVTDVQVERWGDGSQIVAGRIGDEMVLFDGRTGRLLGRRRVSESHDGPVARLCRFHGRPALVTAGTEGVVSLWDPSTRALLRQITVGLPVLAAAPVEGGLALGLDTGLLVVDLE